MSTTLFLSKKHVRRPSFQCVGQTLNEFSKNPILVGFHQTYEPNPLLLISISTYKNDTVAVLFSIVLQIKSWDAVNLLMSKSFHTIFGFQV